MWKELFTFFLTIKTITGFLLYNDCFSNKNDLCGSLVIYYIEPKGMQQFSVGAVSVVTFTLGLLLFCINDKTLFLLREPNWLVE